MSHRIQDEQQKEREERANGHNAPGPTEPVVEQGGLARDTAFIFVVHSWTWTLRRHSGSAEAGSGF